MNTVASSDLRIEPYELPRTRSSHSSWMGASSACRLPGHGDSPRQLRRSVLFRAMIRNSSTMGERWA
jgi:hypothetical protein